MHTHVVKFGTDQRPSFWPAWKRPDGTLIDLRLCGRPSKGCRRSTHVSGTNGGTMPCGSLLTAFGTTKPYYCAACETQSAQERVYNPEALRQAGVPEFYVLEAAKSDPQGFVLVTE